MSKLIGEPVKVHVKEKEPVHSTPSILRALYIYSEAASELQKEAGSSP